MTDDERRALNSAVKHLNAVLSGLATTYGGRLQIRPHGSFDAMEGYSRVTVEVTTGVERFE